MKAKFDCVFYYVSNIEQAIAFYTDKLGLKLSSRDVVARLDLDGVLVELVPAERAANKSGGNARLCLRVDDIQTALAELRTKGVPASAVEPKQNGLLATLQDPDGNEICLWQYT